MKTERKQEMGPEEPTAVDSDSAWTFMEEETGSGEARLAKQGWGKATQQATERARTGKLSGSPIAGPASLARWLAGSLA